MSGRDLSEAGRTSGEMLEDDVVPPVVGSNCVRRSDVEDACSWVLLLALGSALAFSRNDV